MSESSAIVVDSGYKVVRIAHSMKRPFEPKGMRPNGTYHISKMEMDLLSRGKHFTTHGTERGMRYVDFHFSPTTVADFTGVKHADFANIHTVDIHMGHHTSGGPYGVVIGHGIRENFEPANTLSSTIYVQSDGDTTRTIPFHAVVDVTNGATIHLDKTQEELDEEKHVRENGCIQPRIQRAVCFRKNMASTKEQFEYFTSSEFDNGISKSIFGDEENSQYIVQKQEGVPSAAYTYLTAKPNQQRVTKYFERKYGVLMNHLNVNGTPSIHLGPADALVKELKDRFKTLSQFSSPVSRDGLTLRFYDVEHINPKSLMTHVSFKRDLVMEHEGRNHTTLEDLEKIVNASIYP